MTRSLCLSLCVVVGMALRANAEVINVTATRTAYDGALDQVILRVESFTGADLPAAPFLVVLTGSWTFGSGAVNLPGTTTTWASKLLNDFDAQDTDGGVAGVGPTKPQSWVNFAHETSDPASRDGWVSGTLYHGFTEGFFMSDDGWWGGYGVGPVDCTPGDDGSGMGGYGFDNTLLAVFYVTPATKLVPEQTIFSGIGLFWSHYGPGSTSPCDIAVQIVPEPSTLVLVAIGLVTALASFFRRRHVSGG
jgi:hypothetical protein